MTSYAFFGALEQGFAYGLMVIGVYLTFRILDFPDLTVDGSLPLGASVSAVAITAGYPPVVAIAMASGAGFLAGMVTGILNTKLKILHLLASILTMISLYSINLRIMGRPNMTLLGQDTIIDWFMEKSGLPPHLSTPVLFAVICVFVIILLAWFMHTELGLAFLATGNNKQMITSQGVNTDTVIICGVGLSNALVATSGALIAQNQGAADVNMGVGTIVAGLASVIVGETVFGDKTITRALIAVLLGSVLYRIAIALALGMKLGPLAISPSDLNLITSALIIFALGMPDLKKFLAFRRAQ